MRRPQAVRHPMQPQQAQQNVQVGRATQERQRQLQVVRRQDRRFLQTTQLRWKLPRPTIKREAGIARETQNTQA